MTWGRQGFNVHDEQPLSVMPEARPSSRAHLHCCDQPRQVPVGIWASHQVHQLLLFQHLACSQQYSEMSTSLAVYTPGTSLRLWASLQLQVLPYRLTCG